MAPVAVSLVGSGLSGATVAFIGWFGPRGLASVVFGLLTVDALRPDAGRVLLGATVVTVALSVALHGGSATPLAGRYARRVRSLPIGAPEHAPVTLSRAERTGAR